MDALCRRPCKSSCRFLSPVRSFIQTNIAGLGAMYVVRAYLEVRV
jgi:hypothetical protein